MAGGDDAEMAEHDEYLARYNEEFRRLVESAHGIDLGEVEDLVRDFASGQGTRLREVDVALMARFVSDKRWVWKHPVAAVALAWKHRASRAPHRSLLLLARPRITG